MQINSKVVLGCTVSGSLRSLKCAEKQRQPGGAWRGREETPEVACTDREEAAREAEAAEEVLARQVTTAVNQAVFVVYEHRRDLARVGIAALAAEACLPFSGQERS